KAGPPQEPLLDVDAQLLGELGLAGDDRRLARRALVLQGGAAAAVPAAPAVGAPAELLRLGLHPPDLVLAVVPDEGFVALEGRSAPVALEDHAADTLSSHRFLLRGSR